MAPIQLQYSVGTCDTSQTRQQSKSRAGSKAQARQEFALLGTPQIPYTKDNTQKISRNVPMSNKQKQVNEGYTPYAPQHKNDNQYTVTKLQSKATSLHHYNPASSPLLSKPRGVTTTAHTHTAPSHRPLDCGNAATQADRRLAEPA
jgi:hypothetical protein